MAKETETGSLVDRLAMMPAAGREVFDEIKSKLDSVDNGILASYYRVGQLMHELESKPDIYDATHRLTLASLTAERRHTAQRCQAFAERIGEAEFTAMYERVNQETGYRLTWGHIGTLITITQKRSREQWVRRIVDNEITAKEFQREIKRHTDSERLAGNANAGRPFKKPKTLEAGIAQIADTLRQLTARHSQVWASSDAETSVLQDLQEVDEETVSVAMYERVAAAAQVAEEACDAINEVRIALRAASRKWGESLRDREIISGDEVAEEEGEAGEAPTFESSFPGVGAVKAKA